MICPGLSKQNSRKHMGVGSHTRSSHTSLVLSGCERDRADVVVKALENALKGELDKGAESTLTLRAEGVEISVSTGRSNSLYDLVRVKV